MLADFLSQCWSQKVKQSLNDGAGWLCEYMSPVTFVSFSMATAPFCLKLYQEILQSPNGALVWSFLKPVLHGKILYTPNTPEIHQVIQKVSPTCNAGKPSFTRQGRGAACVGLLTMSCVSCHSFRPGFLLHHCQ